MRYSALAGLVGVGLFILAQLAARANLSYVSAGLFFAGSVCEFVAVVLVFRERAEARDLKSALPPSAHADVRLEEPDFLQDDEHRP